MIRSALILWLAFAATANAQLPWDKSAKLEAIGQTQVTFLLADDAQLAEQDGRIAILASGLDDSRQYGVLIVAPQGTEWIEVHDSKQPFPPKVVVEFDKENQPGRYLIRGEPGQQFFVSLRGNGPPQWVEVVVAPEVAPDEPPKPPEDDLTAITELSRAKSGELNDAATAAALKDAINRMCDEITQACEADDCPAVDAAKVQVVTAIENALLARERPDADWLNGWRRPMSEAIKSLDTSTVTGYVAVMRAAAKGL